MINIIKTLEIVIILLKPYPIKWAIGTSTALALHGIDLIPGDIDIVTDAQGALIINELLKPYELKPVNQNTHNESFKSCLGKFLINNIPVDVMGEFNYKSKIDNNWHCMDSELDTVEMIELNNLKIPVFSLRTLINCYKHMGRPKDLDKLARINKIFSLNL